MAELKEGYVDSLVALIRMVSTLTIHCGSKFRIMGWQFYTDILQGVYIPAGKKFKLIKKTLYKKNARRFFASLSQETTKYTIPTILVKKSWDTLT